MQGRLGNVVFFWVAILKLQFLYKEKREIGGGGAVFATCKDKVQEKELHVCRFASGCGMTGVQEMTGEGGRVLSVHSRVYLCSVGALKVLSQRLALVVMQT